MNQFDVRPSAFNLNRSRSSRAYVSQAMPPRPIQNEVAVGQTVRSREHDGQVGDAVPIDVRLNESSAAAAESAQLTRRSGEGADQADCLAACAAAICLNRRDADFIPLSVAESEMRSRAVLVESPTRTTVASGRAR